MAKSHRKSKFGVPGIKPSQPPFATTAAGQERAAQTAHAKKLKRRKQRLQRRYGSK